jgi:hypothetical protein
MHSTQSHPQFRTLARAAAIAAMAGIGLAP